jgi:hypothetical protein
MSKHSKFDPQQPSGRIAFDDRGKAVWEWRTATGDYKSDVDTQTVRALQDSADVNLAGAQPAVPNLDPYSSADSPRPVDKGRRRTLDDMRKLSEEIKRARESKKS